MTQERQEREHAFVDKIVTDPSQPPETILLLGFLGRSSEEGHTRLYLDPRLGEFLEIPAQALLHVQELPASLAPLGGGCVWVRRDAELVHGKAGAHQLKTRVEVKNMYYGYPMYFYPPSFFPFQPTAPAPWMMAMALPPPWMAAPAPWMPAPVPWGMPFGAPSPYAAPCLPPGGSAFYPGALQGGAPAPWGAYATPYTTTGPTMGSPPAPPLCVPPMSQPVGNPIK